MTAYEKPRPRIGPDNEPFWHGCRAHRLMLPTCLACGKPHLPPGPVCPFCFSDDISWQSASGRGRICTWTMVHKAWFPAFRDETPYNVVQVELDEGPRLTSRIVGEGDQKIQIGQRVEVVFDDIDEAKRQKVGFVDALSRLAHDERRQLAAYKIPRMMKFVSEAELPLTVTGKLQKNRLAEFFTRGAWPARNLAEDVLGVRDTYNFDHDGPSP